MRNGTLLTAVLVVAGLVGSPASAAPVQWTTASGGNGHWYEGIYQEGGISWTDAQSEAETLGGYLATLTSQDESTWVFLNIANDAPLWTTYEGPWIGGYQDTEWHWVTGEEWDYTNWGLDSPAAPGSSRDYVHFHNPGARGGSGPSSRWGDTWDTDPGVTSFVVEFIPEASTMVLLLAGIVFCVKKTSAKEGD